MLSESGGRVARKRGEGFFSGPPRPDSLSTAHLTERPDRDRAEGPDDDRWAERNELWFGWGEDWDDAA